MKRFSEQFKKKSDSIRLSASERSDLCARLESYMEYHPLPAEMKTVKKVPVRKVAEGLVSESFKTVRINMAYVQSFAGVFALFMVVGVPIIAERAVPGDMLYAVKTEITEELRASLTLSPYAKVEWETTRLERRVAEARLLASEGKLTPEVEASVAQAIQEHTDAAVLEIAAIRETDEDSAAIAEIAFASALSVQTDVLDGDVAGVSAPEEEITEGYTIAILANVLADASDEADVAQADTQLSYAVLLGSIEAETTRAYELFQTVKKTAEASEIADIDRRLSDVERKLTQALELHNPEQVPVPEMHTEIAEDVPDIEEVSLDTEESETEEGVDATEESAQLSESDDSETQEDKAVEDESFVAQEVRNANAIALLRVALTDVQKLIIFMTDINVRESLTVEELVPVTPTLEEETDAVIKELDTVLEIQEDIEHRTDPATSGEKVLRGKEILSGQVVSVSQLLEDGNIQGAQRVVTEAHAIAEDVQKLVLKEPRREVITEVEPTELSQSEDSDTQEDKENEETLVEPADASTIGNTI